MGILEPYGFDTFWLAMLVAVVAMVLYAIFSSEPS